MENKIINKKYKIIGKIKEGTYGSIYKGQHIKTNELVAIKSEPIGVDFHLLKHETKIYSFLKNSLYIPKIKWFGKDEMNYYMVIDCLGESLQDIMARLNVFSTVLALKIGIKILSILQHIHDKGLVHRDLKPDNFLFGRNDPTKLYLIDFGFCKSFLDEDGFHQKVKQTSGLVGSKNYASVNSHKKIELSRRDDIISMCYMLTYFIKGSLPWNKIEDEEKIMEMKMCFENDADYNENNVFMDILKYANMIEYTENPNYCLLTEILKQEIQLLNKIK